MVWQASAANHNSDKHADMLSTIAELTCMKRRTYGQSEPGSNTIGKDHGDGGFDSDKNSSSGTNRRYNGPRVHLRIGGVRILAG